jgi:hypothetical protein
LSHFLTMITSRSSVVGWVLALLVLVHCICGVHSSSPLFGVSNVLHVSRGGQEEDASNVKPKDDDDDDFEILEETVAYRGWRTITQRKVRMRNGKAVDFDVSRTSG